MVIRKSKDEVFELNGSREAVFKRCVATLRSAGFRSISENPNIFQIQADYHTFTTWGKIEITLTSGALNTTKVTLHTTANVDNLYALFRSPVDKIANAFKSRL